VAKVKQSAMDKAFKLFHDKDYQKAMKAFDDLIENSETPAWIKIKLRQYHRIADHKVNIQEIEENPTLGTVSYFLNIGDFDKAEKLLAGSDFSGGVKDYLRSMVHLGRGEMEKSSEFLKAAIEQQRDNAGYALHSPVFARHMNHDAFAFLRERRENARKQRRRD
jgi:hypothetical protein